MAEVAREGHRAVRSGARREMQPRERGTITRLLADLPRRKDDIDDVVRLAAAGSELIYQGGYLERLRALITDGELRMGSRDEERLVETAAAATGELVRRIEEHLGRFPAAREPWREAGVLETFLVEIAPERRDDARMVVEFAHQASDAPEPVELVGRMALRAVGEDLAEVERFLSELATGEGELGELIAEVKAGCGELARLIAETLPPEPDAEGAIVGSGQAAAQ